MEKEKLTKEIIKKEIIFNSVKGHIAQVMLMLLIAIFSTFLLIEEICSKQINFDNLNVLIYLWLVIPLLFWYGWFFFELLRFLKPIWIVKNNKFSIITDQLKSFKFVTARYGFDYYAMSFLYERKYILPRGHNYKWSEKYFMKDNDVIDCCEIGDEFFSL